MKRNRFSGFVNLAVSRVARVMCYGLVLAPGSLLGQQPASPERIREVGSIPVKLAITESIPYPNASAVIVRRADRNPHDLVLMTREVASVERLTAALWMLEQLHLRYGSVPSESGVFRVERSKGPKDWHSPGGKAGLGPIFGRLASSSVEQLEGFGPVRATTIRVRRYYSSEEGIPHPDK